MTLPYYGRLPNLVSTVGLLDAVREGGLRIARFQRRFTWTASQRVDLFDSIYRGYPIGTLTVWRTRENRLACEPLVGDLPVPRDEAFPEAAVMEYVLDGLQRVSTLYGALGPCLVSTTSDPKARADWEVYFDLDSRTFASDDGLTNADEAMRGRQLPLSIILDTPRLLDELAKHRRHPERIAVAQDLVRKVNAYQVPILPLITESLEDAVESFRRLNSAGTKLDEAAILHALSYRQAPDGAAAVDLLHGFDNVRRRVGGAWESIEALDDATLQHLTREELGLPIYSRDHGRFARELRARPQVLDDVAEGVERAVEFLSKHCGVRGSKVLPYMFQLVLLAFALRRRWPPTETQAEAATRWFWATTYTHHFASQRRIRGTLKDLCLLLDGDSAARLVDDRRVACAGRFQFGRARDKALALTLAGLGPHLPGDPSDGAITEALDLLGDLGGEALHPIVPERPTGQMRLPLALVRSAGNVALVRNSRLGRLRSLLLDEPLHWTTELLESHGIDSDAAALLRVRDHEGFIAARLKYLKGIERARVESLGLEYDESATDDAN